ncbi:hypothetical protein M408DRAFT_316605 [Serendipita vermifera MAFF 305830]|uniref:MYND-type domain-containing protein n=1 Tax=Serendipita vermifera MAFF 305830 TaxID=933852 RepID=A0A0C3AKN6_SERVB|nr:hypothetical protein M408DRAFT_316605 [Serendipita vermifera MAFF 305830]
MIHKSGGSQDLHFVSRFRELIVQNYFKPLLSSSPQFGLLALATRPQPDPLADPSGECSCLTIVARIIMVMQHSLKVVPSDIFIRYAAYRLTVFMAVTVRARSFQPDALELSILIWCLGSTAETTLLGRVAIYGVTSNGIDNDVITDVVTRSMEHISAERFAERCKEALREAIEEGPKNPGARIISLFVVGVICCPAPTPCMSTLDQVLVKQNVHHLILQVARQLVEDNSGVSEELRICFNTVCILAYVLCTDATEKEIKDISFKFFERISHSMECENANCLCWGRTELYENAIRTALEQDMLWLKTLGKLRAHSKDKSTSESLEPKEKALGDWFKLGVALGLQEDPPGGGCQWHECERHGRADEETEWMLRKCSKCWVRYCSVECQRKDWKEGHKKICGTRVIVG